MLYIRLFCFSSEFNQTWGCCSTHRVLQHHQVLTSSDDKKEFYIQHTLRTVRLLRAGESDQAYSRMNHLHAPHPPRQSR